MNLSHAAIGRSISLLITNEPGVFHGIMESVLPCSVGNPWAYEVTTYLDMLEPDEVHISICFRESTDVDQVPNKYAMFCSSLVSEKNIRKPCGCRAPDVDSGVTGAGPWGPAPSRIVPRQMQWTLSSTPDSGFNVGAQARWMVSIDFFTDSI